MKKRRNDKGFTLVELIVVLVILAILAAILVPALLGYIDKAKEKSITTNAEAAYVAAQAVMTERYGKDNRTQLTSGDQTSNDPVQKLAGIGASAFTYEVEYVKSGNFSAIASSNTQGKHDWYTIKKFTYKEDGKIAVWYRNGSGDVKDGPHKGEQAAAGGWLVFDADDEANIPDPVSTSSSGSGTGTGTP